MAFDEGWVDVVAPAGNETPLGRVGWTDVDGRVARGARNMGGSVNGVSEG
jgi:hypothetical protein